jgi:hypothetical protein
VTLDKAAGGQVAQLLGGDLGVEGEVELLEGLRLFEAGSVEPLGLAQTGQRVGPGQETCALFVPTYRNKQGTRGLASYGQ